MRVIEELEPSRQAIFEAQTAFGQTRWNEHLAVDLRLAGERPALQPHLLPDSLLGGGAQAINLVCHTKRAWYRSQLKVSEPRDTLIQEVWEGGLGPLREGGQVCGVQRLRRVLGGSRGPHSAPHGNVTLAAAFCAHCRRHARAVETNPLV